MLRVIVELVPGGLERLQRTIASMTIGNISNLVEVSDYSVNMTEGANPLTGARSRNLKFTVRSHSREQSVWKLIQRAIDEIPGDGS
jgi:hypothetical protein